ncbi:MAG: hypothetical protein A2X64_03210 [Ignavibacteria bacterium GWF2_33_9]|nr:MAG: hypothetical protein A2X64_03210 [Ignavibacteria bacterium GWF2_33_9]
MFKNNQKKNFLQSKIMQIAAMMLILPFTSAFSATQTESAKFEVIESNSNYILIDYTAPEANYKTIFGEGGQIFEMPSISGAYPDEQKPGMPNKFILTANISVPGPNKFKVEYVTVSSILTHSGIMSPSPYLENADEVAVEKYKMNSADYSAPAEDFVNVSYAGIAGSRHIAKITIAAATWDGVKQKILQPLKIRIKVSFENNGSNLVYSNETDRLAKLTTLNYDQTKNFTIPRTSVNQSFKKLTQNQIQENSNNWVKIEVTEDGIYKIDAAQLNAIGAAISLQDVNTIQLFGNGGVELDEKVSSAPSNYMKEQEIQVKTKSDGSLDYILFFGAGTTGFNKVGSKIRRYNNSFSNSNYYMLTWGKTQGKRVNPKEVTGNTKKAPDTYYHRTCFEEEINNPFTKACGRTWFGRSIFSSPFVDMLHNLDRSQPVLMRFSLAHRSGTQGNFIISENNKQIDTLSLYGVSLNSYQHSYRSFIDIEIPSTDIPSDNRSIIKLDYTNPSSPTSSTGFLDYYEIHYPRSFYAIDNELEFIADTTLKGLTEFTINGFAGDLVGFDISEISNPKMIYNSSQTNSIFMIRADLDSFKLNQFYIAGKTKSPKLEKVIFKNILEDDGSNAILITNQGLLNSAGKFKEYRESKSNLKIKIVTVSEIYDEWNAGTPDITAIRDYIAYAYANWENKPEHLIIWGDGHFDYRSIQFKTINPVPAYETQDEWIYTFSETGSEDICTDDFFACVAGNDLMPELSSGRITINTDEEGLDIVNKIKHYENNSSDDDWRIRVFLTADDAEGEYNDGNTHVRYSEDLFRDHMPSEVITDRLYLVEYPSENVPGGKRKPLASEAMVSYLNTTGGVLWNWIGHGNPRVLSHEWWFNRDVNVAQMSNYDKLPFFTAATCDFGRFDDPDTKSGAEELFLNNTGGVIGLLSATRVVYGGQNAQFNNALYDLIFSHYQYGSQMTIGQIIAALKQSYYKDNDRKFFLLGDPTMTLLIPNYETHIDKINNQNLDEINGVMHLKAMEKTDIEGSVINPATKKTDESFNGIAYISVFDGDIAISMWDQADSPSKFNFQKFGGALNRLAVQVENGRFSGSFVIPKDISFSDSAGRIYAYCISDADLNGKKKYSLGTSRKFIVDEVSTTSIIDATPPTIDIFLDSRRFHSGDVVSNNPLLIVDLYDENGINMTGLGVGHLVEAWIDDNPNSINLTNELKTSFEKPNYSLIEKILYGIAPGHHTLKLRAWDVFNNYSIASVDFVTLKPGKSGIINNAYCIPNPFNDYGTKIEFTHTLEPPVSAEITIYNIYGQKVRVLNNKMTDYSIGEIHWDARDENGIAVPQGAYYFRINLENSAGNTVESSDLIGIVVK